MKMKNIPYFLHFCDSPVGRLALRSDGSFLTGLYIQNQTGFPSDGEAKNAQSGFPRVFANTVRWLGEYFSGKNPDFAIPVSFCGTEFQKDVWERLTKIPYGKTVTYGEIAAAIASKRGIKRMSAQAVGGAVGKNPVSIIVPCHRVIGSDGSLTGYNGGTAIKEKLLAIEQGENIRKND